MGCEICENKNEKNVLYENDKIIICSALNPSTAGHLQIYSKNHYTIIEEVPQEILTYMSTASNKISMLLFEALKVHGTNIIIQNGETSGQTIPHFCINIIPRRTDDGMKLDWDLKKASNEELESVHNIISEQVNILAQAPKEQKQDVVIEENTIKDAQFKEIAKIKDSKKIKDNNQDTENEQDSEDDNSNKPKSTNNYLKSLERMP